VTTELVADRLRQGKFKFGRAKLAQKRNVLGMSAKATEVDGDKRRGCSTRITEGRETKPAGHSRFTLLGFAFSD